ncbi:MAG: hypothetical protein JST83_07035 [Bacteroidetes bacterium]|nr:hypothetical protein [Bacteroidota bacterium]
MRSVLLLLLLICCESLWALSPAADTAMHSATHPGCDTVRTGVYITSIHDINFRQNEYAIDLWLWMRYQNPALDFYNNLEVPQAKSVTRSFATLDSGGGDRYLLMKLQCVMQDSWHITNFPFDAQTLRFSVENSQFDAKSMVFVVDTVGQAFDPRFTLRGWAIDTLKIVSGMRKYETNFGDVHIARPHMEYSSFKVRVNISRDAFGLFMKLFLGMYMAFLAAYMCFFIHIDNTDSRFSLSVGGLFAVVGNKYIVDASLPETVTFTLVDLLHGITLFFIIITIVGNAINLKLSKQELDGEAIRFNKLMRRGVLITYVLLNAFFIVKAMKGW